MSENEPTPPSSDPKPGRDRLWLPVLLPLGLLGGMALIMVLFSRILLNTSAAAATIVALVVSATILAVAGVAARGNVGTAALGSVLIAVAGVAMISGAVALAVAEPEEHGVEEHAPGKEAFLATIVAGPNASVDGFEQDRLTFASDVPIELEFDNQEQGVPHDVHIYDSEEDPSGPVLFAGGQTTGPATTTYRVEPLRQGSYFFNCSIHPTTMTGTVKVEQNADTGDELSQTIVASNLAFDTEELVFPPDTPATLALDNQDAGVPHNVAIYGDDSLAEPLFQGETFPGVAVQEYEIPALPEGEYFFHCDVHPTMAGQVVVGPPPGGGGGGGGGSGGEPPADDEVAPDQDDAPPGEPQEQEA